MCRAQCLLEVCLSLREAYYGLLSEGVLSAGNRGALPLLGIWARWLAVSEGKVLWTARNLSALSLCAGLHELIYIFMSDSTVTSPCSLSSVLLGFVCFCHIFWNFWLCPFFTDCVLWRDWLLLPERLANFVKFSICLAYSSNYLLVTPIFSSRKKTLLCFCSLLQSSVHFFVPSRVLRVLEVESSVMFLVFIKNLSAFHVLKSSLEERKKCHVKIQKRKNLVMNLKRSISVAIT